MKVAGIDIGTSNIKVIIFNTDKGVVENIIKETTPMIFNNEFLDVNPIINETIKMIKYAKERYDVKYFGVSSMAPVLTLVNAEGNALGALMYNSLVGNEYLKVFDKELFLRINLNPPNVQMVIQKIMWLYGKKPNIFDKVKLFLDLNGYLFMKLTGKAKQDTHIALEWGLLDYRTRTWSYEIMDSLKIKRVLEGKLPELEEPTYIMDNYTLGTVDVVTSAIGLGLSKGDAFASYGSTFCAGVIAEEPRPSEVLYNDLYLNKGYLINGCNSMYGLVIDWFKNKIARGVRLDVEEVGVEPVNIVFLPYIVGERTPIYDPDAVGVIYGLRDHNDIYDIWRALVFSLAYVATQVLEVLRVSKQDINNVFSYGGLARGPIIDIVSSLTDLRQSLVDVDASMMGGLLLTLMALGYNVDNIRKELLKIKKVIVPNNNIRNKHQAMYELFRRIYLTLKSLYK